MEEMIKKLFSYMNAQYFPVPSGPFFQYNATPQMEGVEGLHNNIIYCSAIIILALSWIIIFTLLSYRKNKAKISNKFGNLDIVLEFMLIICMALIAISTKNLILNFYSFSDNLMYDFFPDKMAIVFDSTNQGEYIKGYSFHCSGEQQEAVSSTTGNQSGTISNINEDYWSTVGSTTGNQPDERVRWVWTHPLADFDDHIVTEKKPVKLPDNNDNFKMPLTYCEDERPFMLAVGDNTPASKIEILKKLMHCHRTNPDLACPKDMFTLNQRVELDKFYNDPRVGCVHTNTHYYATTRIIRAFADYK